MNKTIPIIPLSILITLISMGLSCVPMGESGDQPEPEEAQTQQSLSDPAQIGETLAKRAVLYKIAAQEGDLAPFTAMPETIQDMDIPHIAQQINGFWWGIRWGGARLSPLPSTVITSLEADVFPLISARLEERNDEAGWMLFVLGYDPDILRIIIANAHTEWPPEEHEVFMAGTLDDCLQVWCVIVGGEMKILAHLPCTRDMERPEPPAPPAELFEAPPVEAPESPDEDSGDETTPDDEEETRTEGE